MKALEDFEVSYWRQRAITQSWRRNWQHVRAGIQASFVLGRQTGRHAGTLGSYACRVASPNFVTVCLIESVTSSPGMRDSEQHMALGYWPRR